MNENGRNEVKKVVGDSLENEVKKFANEFPYWIKYLANKILSGNEISQNDIDETYLYLLEDLGITEKTTRTEITLSGLHDNERDYYSNLMLSKLENVEGVNALLEGQSIEFSPNLTIIYGSNGSGKSGYTRLLKNVFYSKSKEKILSNIYSTDIVKPVNANFIFKSEGNEISVSYNNNDHSIFEQFSVFDGKSAVKHIESKNEFEFKPAGLNFFGKFADALSHVEKKLNNEVTIKQQGTNINNLLMLFDGNSEVTEAIQAINTDKGFENLSKIASYTEKNTKEKESVQKKYEELQIASTKKDQEIRNLNTIKKLLLQVKQSVEKFNQYFSNEMFEKANQAIIECLEKEEIAKNEGVENFKTDNLNGIGTSEWKNFILSAEKFALLQENGNSHYPKNEDHCLFCQQKLSEPAQKLIINYRKFIESVSEKKAAELQNKLNKAKKLYDDLDFNLFPPNNILTNWLIENYPIELEIIKHSIEKQQILAEKICSDIQNKVVNEKVGVLIETNIFETIEIELEKSLTILNTGNQFKDLERLRNSIINLEHKEKLSLHFPKFENYFNMQVWLNKASKANFPKQKITLKEKELSSKYFSENYVSIFNNECQKLNGDFGIEINRTSTAGKSYRQLRLKGKNPNTILSEGEQKVIATADFLAEMKLSEINRGIIFDDPVTSLDDKRKNEIATRLVEEAELRQVIIFTHDLVFVSNLLSKCEQQEAEFLCHWIENIDGKNPGAIYLNNAPSYEKDYKTSGKAQNYLNEAKKSNPQQREEKIKNGFAALRTSYEAQVVFGLFKGVVQRFNERVSIESLRKVYFTTELIDELLESYALCCRFMEGHSHSDKYSYKKPTIEDLNNEIKRFDEIKKKISSCKKNKS
ncbi:AAA family ATPase [Lactococcus raffinolactis]|uniref:AAA family ATPase n=1 Tax=Pseudolactococcus raffinolactis TaxID=1366 RepID=UPI00289CCE50|nr:AAA family ATPase [Lactococcus raffinolactis]